MRGSRKVPLKESVLILVIASFILPLASAQSGEFVSGGGQVLVPTSLDTNKCFECHSDSSKVEDTTAATEWKDSVHYKNDIGCERCHSASVPAGRLAVFDVFGGSYRDDHIDLILNPDIAYKSPEAFDVEGKAGEYSYSIRLGLIKQQETAMCARCHGLTPLNPESPKDVFQDYIKSVHGQSVVVKGLGDPERVGKTEVEFTEATGALDSAVCTDCHNPHATKAKDDPASESHKDNVVKLCGNVDACHGSDDVTNTYGIVNGITTFDDTHHGKAMKFGVEGLPNCVDCHAKSGSHLILSQSDPNSDIHPDNAPKICADEDCHGVEFNMGKGSMHGKDKDTFIGNLIDLFYKIVILGAAGFFAIYVVLDATMMLGKKGGE